MIDEKTKNKLFTKIAEILANEINDETVLRAVKQSVDEILENEMKNDETYQSIMDIINYKIDVF